MQGRWNPFGFQLSFSGLLILFLEIQNCVSLNPEGWDLLEFRASVEADPYGAFANWNVGDAHPCMWLGVHCVDGKINILDLSGFSLKGILAPGLGKLSHLRSLVLYKNRFSGSIPKEFEGLKMLELLDLRHNNLSGTIPAEVGGMFSLKRLLLCENNFQGIIPPELQNLNFLAELRLDQNVSSASTPAIDCGSRNFGHCIWNSILLQLKNANYFILSMKGVILRHLDNCTSFRISYFDVRGQNISHGLSIDSSERSIIKNVQHVANMVRRRLFEVSSNLPASPASGVIPSEQMSPISISSGSFPAVASQSPPSLNHSSSSPNRGGQSAWTPFQKNWKLYVSLSLAVLLLVIFVVMFCICHNRGTSPRDPWATGLSGQLQKALVNGVPKLNRVELETACEAFSNVLVNLAGCTVYKGTLSSGIEIAVASTTVSSHRNWSRRAEMAFRKKLDILSRVNHKNFVNLLGYCSEDKPFMRMMVFEHAPNGTLYEHLHVKEAEHLEWHARVRIIMGMAYCLQHMHHELNPPVAHPNLQSSSILLTDDYAAKIAEIGFWIDIVGKSKIHDEEESEHSRLHHIPNPNDNVYSFGVMLLEIICGKVPYNEEDGPLLNWAAKYWNDKRRISYMIDPKLKSFQNNELDIICEVIQECINPDPNLRPTMREIISKLREVIPISPDAASPKLSPIWWAELEILSIEAS